MDISKNPTQAYHIVCRHSHSPAGYEEQALCRDGEWWPVYYAVERGYAATYEDEADAAGGALRARSFRSVDENPFDVWVESVNVRVYENGISVLFDRKIVCYLTFTD